MRDIDWFIARHYLRSGRGGFLSLITWIALGGVILGVAALIIVISVMSGMQSELRGKILESTPHLYVFEYGESLRLSDYQSVVDKIRTVDGVTTASPFALSSVTLLRAGGQYSQPAYLLGVHMEAPELAATDIERQMIEGSLNLGETRSGLPPLLVGSELANRMQLFTGDTMVVMSMENLNQDMFGGFSPTIRQYEVSGTFRTGMYEYDVTNIYTTLEDARDLLGLTPADASGIGVRTDDPDAAQAMAEEVSDLLGIEYSVESWITRHAALFSALQLEKLALGLIVFLIVLVAAFNIVSTLVMVVSDRTREIGILRTMGMTQRGILRVFVIQGVWIGVIGTTAGATLGIVISWALDRFELIRIPGDVYGISHLPARLDPFDIALIVVASIAVSFVATIHPARQAARLEPVDAIRHE